MRICRNQSKRWSGDLGPPLIEVSSGLNMVMHGFERRLAIPIESVPHQHLQPLGASPYEFGGPVDTQDGNAAPSVPVAGTLRAAEQGLRSYGMLARSFRSGLSPALSDSNLTPNFG